MLVLELLISLMTEQWGEILELSCRNDFTLCIWSQRGSEGCSGPFLCSFGNPRAQGAVFGPNEKLWFLALGVTLSISGCHPGSAVCHPGVRLEASFHVPLMGMEKPE